MFKLSPLVRLSSGLVFITISILLLADLIGLSPNTSNFALSERRKMAEFLTIQIMRSIQKGEEEDINPIMEIIKERNPDILSLAIRKIDGVVVHQIGPHDNNWHLTLDDPSTSEFIQVPVFRDEKDWGRIELRYTPLQGTKAYFGYNIDNSIILTLFVGAVGYLIYALFLRRTLRYLDPSRVIPDRVKNAMNALSEGVLILDNKGSIMLSNKTFCEKVGLEEKKLLGKSAASLAWEVKKVENSYPWLDVVKNQQKVSSRPIIYKQGKVKKTFMVNASPVEGEGEKIRGVICTFDDVTALEEKNAELVQAMEVIEKSKEEITQKNHELSILASTDSLTGCLNRRSFFDDVTPKFKNLNTESPMTCLMVDIDHFKNVNDNYGHGVGDIVIVAMANVLKSTVRKNDYVCRYGGEEFCVVLVGTTTEFGIELGERIRDRVSKLRFEDSKETEDLHITASLGVTDSTCNAENIEDFIDQADQALYYSKENGRNRVTSWKEIINAEKQKEEVSAEVVKPESHNVINAKENNLPNRQLFLDLICQSIMNSKSSETMFAVLLINVDNFKRINNSMGMSCGDDVLKQIGTSLAKLIRTTDILSQFKSPEDSISPVAQMAGDEFALLAQEFKKPNDVFIIAKRILQCLDQPYTVEGTEIKLNFSIGICLYPFDAKSSEGLINNAELALQRAKKEEGNAYKRFMLDVDSLPTNSISIENDLRKAIENKEFVVYYQPKIELQSNSINSAEALVRWMHPEKGLIPPMSFIPIAEGSGLINQIGHQVMESAMRQTKVWNDNGYPDFSVSINISPLQLKQKHFEKNVLDMINLIGVNPKNIEFELTETVLMENIQSIVPMFETFHQAGISLSIDDFGVGYSSLNYIKRLPVDRLKIDRTFVSDIENQKDDRILVAAMVAMSHAMHLSVVAEGVENEKQLRILNKLKCDYVQGFYFSKPLPEMEFSALLKRDWFSDNIEPNSLRTSPPNISRMQ